MQKQCPNSLSTKQRIAWDHDNNGARTAYTLTSVVEGAMECVTRLYGPTADPQLEKLSSTSVGKQGRLKKLGRGREEAIITPLSDRFATCYKPRLLDYCAFSSALFLQQSQVYRAAGLALTIFFFFFSVSTEFERTLK